MVISGLGKSRQEHIAYLRSNAMIPLYNSLQTKSWHDLPHKPKSLKWRLVKKTAFTFL